MPKTYPDYPCDCGHFESEHSPSAHGCYIEECRCGGFDYKDPECPECGVRGKITWISCGNFLECAACQQWTYFVPENRIVGMIFAEYEKDEAA